MLLETFYYHRKKTVTVIAQKTWPGGCYRCKSKYPFSLDLPPPPKTVITAFLVVIMCG